MALAGRKAETPIFPTSPRSHGPLEPGAAQAGYMIFRSLAGFLALALVLLIVAVNEPRTARLQA